MDGVTWSARPNRATPPKNRLPRLSRNTRITRAGRLTGLHWEGRLNTQIDRARATWVPPPEVPKALTGTKR